MKKHSILIKESSFDYNSDTCSRSCRFFEDSEEVLDAIVKFTEDKVTKIYKHIVREDIYNDNFYILNSFNYYRGDSKVWLHIYYEE